MTKRILSLFIWLILSGNVFAQMSMLDSINSILQNDYDDTLKIDLINELGFTLANSNPVQTMDYINYAINKSIEINDSIRLAQSYSRKGVVFYYTGDFNSALEFYKKSSTIFEMLDCKELLLRDYNNIALVYKQQKQYPIAINYFKESIRLGQLLNHKSNLALNYNNLGIVYRSMGELDSAFLCYNKALELNRIPNNKQYQAYIFNNIGNIYFDNQDYQEALTFYFRSLSLNMQLKNKYEQVNVENNIANTYLKLKSYKLSLRHLQNNIKTIEELNSTTLKLANIDIWIDYYNAIGDYSNSIKYYKLYIHIKDSLNQLEQEKKYELINSLYQAEKKDLEINFLKDKSLLLADKVKRQRIINIGFIILSIFTSIIIVLIFYLLKLKNQANKKLEKLVKERTFELEQAKEKAELSDKLKTSFLSNISHEVRTPMNAIVGYASLINDSEIELHEKTLFIEQIEKSTQHLLKLFENITLLARLENNDIQITTNAINLENIFLSLFNKFNKIINDNNLLIKLNYTIEPYFNGLSLKTDAYILKQIFEHLLENAFKFTDSGQIDFGIKNIDNKPVFYVKDTGCGIKDEDLPHVFEKFRQFNASYKKLFDGAGIGLTIVSKNIELLNGHIKINSQDQRGTLVEFLIPCPN